MSSPRTVPGTVPGTFPGIWGCSKLGPAAVLSVLRSPRMVGVVWLALSIPSFLMTLQYFAGLDSVLANNPLAQGREGGLLIPDIARIQPGVAFVFGSLWLPCLLIMTFFAGGILACVGIKAKRRVGITDFLAESGQYFFRSIRSLVPMLVGLLVWTWSWSQYIEPALTQNDWVAGSESYMYAAALIANLIFLAGFASLLILRRLAIAKLVWEQRHSALLAWGCGVKLLFSRPLACFLAYAGLFTFWATLVVLATLVLDPLFVQESYLLALLVSQLLAFSTVACAMGGQILARKLWTMDAAVRMERGEPVVTLPRGEPTLTPRSGEEVAHKIPVKG